MTLPVTVDPEAAESYLPRTALARLLACLEEAGYQCVGPQVRDGALVYEPLDSAAALPHGIGQVQEPGSFRLQNHGHSRCFAWANGPLALKPYVFPSREPLWQVERDRHGHMQFHAERPAVRRQAILGVRACDLAALGLNDAHFLDQSVSHPGYAERRAALFLIAVDCSHPASTCFCVATGDGPAADSLYDLAMRELDEGFLVRAGSEQGRRLMQDLPLVPASDTQRRQADEQLRRARERQQRSLPDTDIRARLFERLDHPRWHHTADRCLACGNCTAVCPTCFCHREVEQPSLDGHTSAHVREWDSCFSYGHSVLSGRPVRADARTRYRQWLTHKHGAWVEQYGRSGCVGCGRCITWCPVGIDILEELHVLCAEA